MSPPKSDLQFERINISKDSLELLKIFSWPAQATRAILEFVQYSTINIWKGIYFLYFDLLPKHTTTILV